MSNYVKGFSVSLFLHGTVLLLTLWFALGASGAEKEVLLVDFSTITLGEPNEGGASPGTHKAAPGKNGNGASVPEQYSNRPPSQIVEAAPLPTPETLKPEPVVTPQAKTVVTPTSKPVAKPKPSRPSSSANVETRQSTAREMQTQAPSSSSGAAGVVEAGGGTQVGSETGRGTGPGMGTGTGQGLAQGYVKSNFNYILVSIQRNLQYPDFARRKRLTGTVHFAFVIRQDGSIEDLNLKKSSGHDILDEAAQKAIQQAAPFPRPPVPALLVVPINFRLGKG